MLKVLGFTLIVLPTTAWAQSYDELQSYLEQQQADTGQEGLEHQQVPAQENTQRQEQWWDETMQQSRLFVQGMRD